MSKKTMLALRLARARASNPKKHESHVQKGGWIRNIFQLANMAYVAAGYAIGLLTNALDIPQKIVNFQDYLPEARSHIYNMVYDPAAWNGKFDSFPEGIVDIADYEIVDKEHAALEIEIVDGNRIDGRIWWNGSCDLGSVYSGILLDGKIDFGGRSANVRVWDIVGGHKVTFFYGKIAQRGGGSIAFSDFPDETGLNGTLIVRNPEPSHLEDWETSETNNLYCDWYIKMIGDLRTTSPR